MLLQLLRNVVLGSTPPQKKKPVSPGVTLFEILSTMVVRAMHGPAAFGSADGLKGRLRAEPQRGDYMYSMIDILATGASF